MEKIKSLGRYQKGILLFMLVSAIVFAVLYSMTISKVGYRYNDAILVPTQENGDTLYSGKINGQQACFTVSDNTVVFQYGDKTYGPYTVKVDPTAIPEDSDISGHMTGLEISEGSDILFRGGVMDAGEFCWFYNEDGTTFSTIVITHVTSNGIVKDSNGNPIDRMKPSVSTIYDLTNNPELTHKGNGLFLLYAMFCYILNTISIIFADELFRLNLMFKIRYAEDAEPSDWLIAGRYIGWTAITILGFIVLIMGLL